MAMHVPQAGFRTMMKDGAKYMSGLDEAVYRNITACKDIAQIVRSSYGPNGMNKMIINHLDKLFVTNDAATIIRELEVEHPAAKIVIMASQQQEHEVGDGTNFVIIFAGKLLERAENLLRMGLSPPEVIEGYEKAAEQALEILPELVCAKIEDVTKAEDVMKGLRPVLASKQWGYEDFLAGLVAEACLAARPKDTEKPFNVDHVRVLKVTGAGVGDSRVMKGMVFARPCEGTVSSLKQAKVAVYTCIVDSTQTETKGTVLINSAEELKAYSRGDEDLLESQIKAIADAGITCVVSGGGKIGELAVHFLNKYGIMAIRLLSKHELRRLCKTIGATPLPRLVPPTSNETGHCDSIFIEEIGDTDMIVFRQDDESSAISTVIVRGATSNIMDDVERAIDDGVNVFKLMTKDARMVPGAGATEIELARKLAVYGESKKGLEQYAITQFAEAFEAMPYALAENAGIKAQEVVSRLYAAHQRGESGAGFDNEAEGPAVTDAAAKGILDNLMTKHWAIKHATHAATTVLRVDQIIMAKKAGGPKPPKQPAMDAD